RPGEGAGRDPGPHPALLQGRRGQAGDRHGHRQDPRGSPRGREGPGGPAGGGPGHARPPRSPRWAAPRGRRGRGRATIQAMLRNVLLVAAMALLGSMPGSAHATRCAGYYNFVDSAATARAVVSARVIRQVVAPAPVLELKPERIYMGSYSGEELRIP